MRPLTCLALILLGVPGTPPAPRVAAVVPADPKKLDMRTLNVECLNILDGRGNPVVTLTSADGGPVMLAVGADGTLRAVELHEHLGPTKGK